jgi:hypothetical protein
MVNFELLSVNVTVEFANHPVNGKQGPAALTNKKQDNFDQKYTPRTESTGVGFPVRTINARNI